MNVGAIPRGVAREVALAAEPYGSRLAMHLDSVLSRAMIGDTCLGDVLTAQTRIRVEGAGPVAARQLIPETPSAAELLSDGPDGPVAQALRGYVGLVDPTGQHLHGLALSTGKDGYFANQFLNFSEGVPVEVGFPRLADVPPGDLTMFDGMGVDFVDALRAQLVPHGVPSARVDAAGWITVAPGDARPFEEHLRSVAGLPGGRALSPRRADEIAHIMTHEGGHLRPDRDTWSAELSWLEEARTELRARLTSNVRRTAEVLRLPHGLPAEELAITRHPGLEDHPYTGGTDALAATLQRGGIDASTPRGAAEATAFVDSSPLSELPDRLAGRIIEHRGMEPSLRPRLAKAIETVGPHPFIDVALEHLSR